MRSRFLADLTTPEVEGYLEEGGTTALIPVGCTEMHGPHQPIGTDTMTARGFALLLANETNALVFPAVPYTWAGSTDGFAGTVSVSPELVQQLVTTIIVRAWNNGFRRIVVISCHGGNQQALTLVVRRVFETHHIPAAFINPGAPASDAAAAVFAGELAQASEASRLLAALHILGLDGLYSEEEMRDDDHPPPLPESLRQFPFAMGYFMQDPRQHACPSPHVSLERGMTFYREQLKVFAPHIEKLETYLEETEGQWNKGWWTEADSEL